MTKPATERFVTTEEAAEFLGKPVSWLYNSARRLGLPRHRLGRQYRYRLSELAEWLERQGE